MNRRLLQTRFPGIAEVNALAEGLRQDGRSLVNLGQAVPYYPPPAEQVKALGPILENEPLVHRYTLDPGLLSLRQALTGVLRQRFALGIDPETEMLITSGANAAYSLAVMAMMNPGDRMGLLTPWYFNHEMVVRMVGGEPVPIALSPQDSFKIDPERIAAEAVHLKLRALTIVTPNNPTGQTYSPECLQALAEKLLAKGIFLICDETYGFLTPPGECHFSCGSLEASPSQIITVGSFSKTFAMTGWRVGYVLASSALVSEMLKAQDTVFICASHPGQRLAQNCLEHGWTWMEERRQELAARRALFLERARNWGDWKVRSSGLFFAWLEAPMDGRVASLSLLREEGVILIPGDVFGPGCERALRVSLGGCDPAEFADALDRLDAGLARLGK